MSARTKQSRKPRTARKLPVIQGKTSAGRRRLDDDSILQQVKKIEKSLGEKVTLYGGLRMLRKAGYGVNPRRFARVLRSSGRKVA
jgi:hypothetical protein